MRALARYIGTALVAVGLGTMLMLGAIAAYGEWDRAQLDRTLALTPIASPTIEPTPTEPASPTAVAIATPMPAAAPSIAVPTLAPSPTPTSKPSATPIPRLPVRIVATAIALDSRVVEAPIVNEQWQVPKFVAGHLERTALVGESGNIVLAGHLESISSGNVFANIGDLELGNEVLLYTDRGSTDFVVADKRIVANDDISVVQPTEVETLTLITCYGNFIPAIRDYDRRLIIVARHKSAMPITREPVLR